MNTKQFTIPVKLNLVLMITLTLINWFAMFYLPLVLVPHSALWLLLLLPILLFTNTYWSLIHEGIHHIFANNKMVNNFCSRVMAITFGTVFSVVQFGHLMHHAFNRTPVDRPEVYEPETQNYVMRSISYYFKLIIGLYVVEFFGPLLAYCPKSMVMKVADNLYSDQPQFEKIVKNRLLSDQSLQRIRFDASIMYLVYIAVFICYGSYWWVWLCVMLARGFMVSVADNLPHYGTSVNDVRYAYNLSIAPLLSKLLLHFNLHRIHHEQPNVPWTGLPKIQQRTNDTCEINYFKQALKQFKGLIDIAKLHETPK